MKKKTMNELMKLKETFIDVFDEFNTTDIEIKTYLSRDCYSTYYKTVEMHNADSPLYNGEMTLFDVTNITEANEEDTDNGCIFGIALWEPDGDGDIVFECSEDEIKEACNIICGWIEEYVEKVERQKNIVDAYNAYKPFDRFKEDYTWKEFKEDYDLPKSWSIAAFKREAKRAAIKLIGKVY